MRWHPCEAVRVQEAPLAAWFQPQEVLIRTRAGPPVAGLLRAAVL